MTWHGVPVLDWMLLILVLGLGIEAWLTTRPPPEDEDRKTGAVTGRAAARRKATQGSVNSD